MAAPTNITRLAAFPIIALPYTTTQDVNDSGTTYSVWYSYAAPADATIKIYASGDDGYQPFLDVYQDLQVSLWLNLGQLWDPINAPIYIPVVGGHTYYFNLSAGGASSGFVENAVLMLAVDATPSDAITQGDFLVNYEVDFDSEYPVAVLSGSADHTVKKYVQVAPAVYPRTEDGLPHGQTGQVFQSGVVVWADEQYNNIKFYNANTLLRIATLATDNTPVMGMNRTTDRLYALTLFGGTSTLRSYDDTGTLRSTLVLSSAITIVSFIGINSDASIMYYVPGGTTRIRRWDLVNNVALSDLVADTVGYRCEDLLVLEDDTILCSFFKESGTPKDVYVEQLNAAGSVLNTYNFGAHWRDSFNPPRMGYALDSPLSFWIRLEPEGIFDLSIYKNIEIATGNTLTTRNHTNDLGGVSLGAKRQGFANTQNTTFSMLPAMGQTSNIRVQVLVTETFANGTGTQTTFKIGRTGALDSIAPTATFTDAVLGTGFSFTATLSAGQDVTVTGTTRTGTGTGRIYVGVYNTDNLDTLGGEKSGALLVVPTSGGGGGIVYPPDFTPGAGVVERRLIRRMRRSPHISTEELFNFFGKLQIDMETGVGITSGQGSDPKICLRWSDDHGHSFSNEHWISVGKIGEWRKRAIWWRLGRARDRVFEVSMSDPVRWSLIAAYLDVKAGSS